MKDNFSLDRTQFSKMTFEQADKAINDYRFNTAAERLEIANRLIAIAYNFPLNEPPGMDKNFFEARSLKNGKYIQS